MYDRRAHLKVHRVAFAAMVGCAGFACGILAFTIRSMVG
jgi:hypothetical protein